MSWARRAIPFAVVGGLMAGLAIDLASGRWLNQVFLAMPGIDKVTHVVFFGALFVCLRQILDGRGVPPRWRTPVAAGTALLVGTFVELMQGVWASGSVEAADLVADASGIALGWVAAVRPPRLTAMGATAAALAAAGVVTYQTYAGLVDYSRAQRYLRQGDLVSARASLRLALGAGVRRPSLYNDLGWVEIESGVGDPGQAVEYARTALEMQPGSADVLDTYGWALHHAGRSQEALAPLLDAYARKPRMYCIHYHLGVVYLALGREPEAAAHLTSQLAFAATREARLARQALDRLAARR
jgi:Tfp pilus assembly protein PilF